MFWRLFGPWFFIDAYAFHSILLLFDSKFSFQLEICLGDLWGIHWWNCTIWSFFFVLPTKITYFIIDLAINLAIFDNIHFFRVVFFLAVCFIACLKLILLLFLCWLFVCSISCQCSSFQLFFVTFSRLICHCTSFFHLLWLNFQYFFL